MLGRMVVGEKEAKRKGAKENGRKRGLKRG
jgi:hypothetical protein